MIKGCHRLPECGLGWKGPCSPSCRGYRGPWVFKETQAADGCCKVVHCMNASVSKAEFRVSKPVLKDFWQSPEQKQQQQQQQLPHPFFFFPSLFLYPNTGVSIHKSPNQLKTRFWSIPLNLSWFDSNVWKQCQLLHKIYIYNFICLCKWFYVFYLEM